MVSMKDFLKFIDYITIPASLLLYTYLVQNEFYFSSCVLAIYISLLWILLVDKCDE